MSMKLLTPRSVAIAVVGVVALFALAHDTGSRYGEHRANEQIRRTQLIWSDAMDMPRADRALIAGLSITCNLEDEPPVRAAVIACLRRGAAAEKPMLPNGVSRADAAARLEALISGATEEQQD